MFTSGEIYWIKAFKDISYYYIMNAMYIIKSLNWYIWSEVNGPDKFRDKLDVHVIVQMFTFPKNANYPITVIPRFTVSASRGKAKMHGFSEARLIAGKLTHVLL